MSEQELAKHVVAWLEEQHWDVYQEVQIFRGGKVADIIAVRGSLLWVIECKKSLSLAVMEQASYWRTHYRSVAVPRQKNEMRRVGIGVAKNYYQIGVLTVGEGYFDFGVDEIVSAPLKREFHRFAKDIQKCLLPEHKTYAMAGSNDGGHYTPYKRTMDAVKSFIEKNPGCTLKEIIDSIGKGHYANSQSARGTIRVALSNWESDWCHIEIATKPYKYFLVSSARD
ncbi:hypothetical protein LCGC14_0665710 [marine sediment metagenome]|uniref:NERD domain-containing protein n=1 Tax=marine sediment metagenome TaxID=412755 RepID=A0A0F9QSB2_9ZZZZ